MDPVTLTPTFANSFWSRDYRHGFQVLYDTLSEGLEESESISSFIRARISVESSYARHLSDIGTISDETWENEDRTPRVETSRGLLHDGGGVQVGVNLVSDINQDLDSGVGPAGALPFPPSSSPSPASPGIPLVITALASSNAALATSHAHTASALTSESLTPLVESIALLRSHLGRSRETLEAALEQFETQSATVARVKAAYAAACRECDVMEDEMRFVGADPRTSPRAKQGDGEGQTRQEVVSGTTRDTAEAPGGGIGTTREKETGTMAKTALDVTSVEEGEVSLSRIETPTRSDASSGAVSSTKASPDSSFNSDATSQMAAPTYSAFPPTEYDSDSSESLSDAPTLTHALTRRFTRLKRLTRDALPAFSALSALPQSPRSAPAALAHARTLAAQSEAAYRREVAVLDEIRLALEQNLDAHYAYAQKCETRRVVALASSLNAYARLAADTRVSAILPLLSPARAVRAVIERRRTGPFVPTAVVFEPHYAEPYTAAFGAELRGPGPGPALFSAMLATVCAKATPLSRSARRRAWLLEAPLKERHAVRRRLNSAPPRAYAAVMEPVNVVLLADTLKLWLLELPTPVIVYSHYEEYRGVYPRGVPNETKSDVGDEARDANDSVATTGASESEASELGRAHLTGELLLQRGALPPLGAIQNSGETQISLGERVKTNREDLIGPNIGSLEHHETAKDDETVERGETPLNPNETATPVKTSETLVNPGRPTKRNETEKRNAPSSGSNEGAATLHKTKPVSTRFARVSRQLSYLPVEHYNVLKELMGYLSSLYREGMEPDPSEAREGGEGEEEGKQDKTDRQEEEGKREVPHQAQKLKKDLQREEKKEETEVVINNDATVDASETVSPTLRVSEAPDRSRIRQISSDPEDATFLAKLSLSLARCIIRPKTYTALTLDDRFPIQLVTDLIAHYDLLFSEADSLRQSLAVTLEKPKRKRSFFLSDKRGAPQAGGLESTTGNGDRYGLSLKVSASEVRNAVDSSDKPRGSGYNFSDSAQITPDMARRSARVLSDTSEASAHAEMDNKQSARPSVGSTSSEMRVLSSSDRLAAKLADRLSARRLASASEKATQNQSPNDTLLPSSEIIKGPPETAQNLPSDNQGTAENTNIKIATQHLGVTLQDIPLDSPIHKLQNVDIPQNIQESTQDEKKKLTIATNALDSDEPPFAFPSPL